MKTDIVTKTSQFNLEQKIINDIIKIVANHFSFEENFYKIISREKNLIHAKHVTMYLIKKNHKITLAKLGSYFSSQTKEGLDHATVLNAVNKIKDFMSIDKSIKSEVNYLQKLVEIKIKENKECQYDKDYYYISLDSITSMKIREDAAIITTGLTQNEINCIKKAVIGILETREHKNTNLFILEPKKQIN
jgi:hypothetical protein